MFGKLLLSALTLSGIAGITLGAIGLSGSDPTTDSQRADCPGKIVCPLSGDEVCKDQCPLIDKNRADCPGRIECPLNGELVCKDQCPLNQNAETNVAVIENEPDTTDAKPACCINRN